MPHENDQVILTEPQLLALWCIELACAQRGYSTPAEIGQAMCKGESLRGRSAQGLGRQGGVMASRLRRRGLVDDRSAEHHGFPAYGITAAGRAALDAYSRDGVGIRRRAGRT